MKIHLLTRFYTRIWYTRYSPWPWVTPEKRPEIAKMILEEHGRSEPVAIARFTLHVIAIVHPNERIEQLPTPYRKVKMSAIANRPAVPTCQCAPWWEPTIRGAWRESDGAKRGEHHPLCQFNPECWKNFQARRQAG